MPFAQTFTAQPADIDELGHVNNTVWLRWVQDIATAHWRSVAEPAFVDRFIWVVTRHEIDYRGNVGEGASVEGTTWIPDPPRGARFDRRVDFRNDTGKLLVSVRSTWAMLDRESGKLARISADVARPFMTPDPPAEARDTA